MGFFSREKPETAEIAIGFEMQLEDVDSLLRIAEKDEAVNAVILNYQTQVRILKEQSQMGGGMRPEDWRIVAQDATRASESMKALGYDIDPILFETLD
jgi:hypothetical protein